MEAGVPPALQPSTSIHPSSWARRIDQAQAVSRRFRNAKRVRGTDFRRQRKRLYADPRRPPILERGDDVIVECTKCETRFQLEESRVPAGGVRVRCSRCKEAFFLQHPSAEEAVSLESVPVRTASEEEPVLVSDDSSECLPGESDLEEDWEFNHEPGVQETDDPCRADGVKLELGRLQSVELAPDLASGDLDGSFLLSDLSPDEDFSEDAGLEGGRGLALPGDASSRVGDETCETGEVEAEIDLGPDGTDSDFVDAADFSSLLDDLADEEFADHEIEARPEADALPRQRELGPQLAALPARRVSRLRAGGRAAGWLATLALGVFGVAAGVFPVASPGPTIVSVDLGDLRARAIHATWLETSGSNRLYVVNAKLVNETARAIMAGTSIQVALLSSRGERLEVPAVPVGVALAEPFLRESPRDELARAATAARAQLAMAPIAPGQAVEIQAFFDPVPEEAASFRIERIALSSDGATTTRSFGPALGEPDPTKLP